MTFMKTYIVAVRGQTEKLKLIKARGDDYRYSQQPPITLHSQSEDGLPMDELLQATKDNPHFLNIKTYLINQQISRFMKPKHIHTLYFCCNYDIPKF